MSTIIEKDEKQATKREFVGRVWKNEVREGEHKGKTFFNIRIDEDVKKLVLSPESKIQLWANKQRNDKINPKTGQLYQDADYRMSIILPEDEKEKE